MFTKPANAFPVLTDYGGQSFCARRVAEHRSTSSSFARGDECISAVVVGCQRFGAEPVAIANGSMLFVQVTKPVR
jgi:hypothetical protein